MTVSMLGWVVGVILVLLILLLCIWWLRNRSGAAIRSFYFAVRQMEQEQGVRDHYQTPWLMMVGDEPQGSQLCTSWSLSPAGKPAWFGRWWSDPEGAVLVVPQSVFLPDEGMKLQGSGWWSLLGLFLRIRSRRPLDAVIWNVSAADLLDTDRAAALGLSARRRFVDLLQRLGLSLPVYVVVNGMNEVPGFQDLVAALPEDAQQQMLGWSSPYSPDAVWESQWSDIALDQVIQALSEASIQIGALSGHLTDDLSFLPEGFEGLRRNLQMLLEPVFQGNSQGEAAVFRGLYFTGTSGQTAAGDDALSAFDAPAMHSVFTQQLWRLRINAERGLGRPVPRLLQLRQRWQRIAGVVVVIVGVLWTLVMLWVWRHSVADADQLSRLLQDSQRDYGVVSDETDRLDVTRRNVQSFWSVLENAPRWHFTAVVYPTSWFSSLDDRLDLVLQHTFMSHMRQPLHDLLKAELRDLLAITEARRLSGKDGDDPAQWHSYLRAEEIVARSIHLEHLSQLYTQAMTNQRTPLDDLVPLSNSALGLNLNVGTLHRVAFYNRLLVEKSLSPLEPMGTPADRKLIAMHFTKLLERWLGHYFRVDNFEKSAESLKLNLQHLESNSENSLQELESLNTLIDDLQAAVDLTNSTWSRGKGQELVPGYVELIERAKQSKLLGPLVAEEIESQAAEMQHSFKVQFIAQGAAGSNLLVQGGGGQLALQDRITELHTAVALLLKRNFVARALRRRGPAESEQIQQVDNESLSVALGYYDSYKLYAHEALSSIPPIYRQAMLGAAEQTAAESMVLSLRSRVVQPDQENVPVFDVRTDQALALHAAFIELRRPDLAISLQNYLNRVALADVTMADNSIMEQPLFSNRADISEWDGSKNFGLLLFRATDAQDLKRSLDQQFTVISAITEQHGPALQWLQTQTHNLPLGEVEMVNHFGSMNEEMIKYKAQNPTSSPALITQLLSRDFNDMDDSSCMSILLSASAPTAAGQLTQRWLGLQQGALQRCKALQQQQASAAWNALAGYFNQYLAGRFPFSTDLRAKDADPARVQHFLSLIDAHLSQAQDGLKSSAPHDRLAANEFLERLKQARPWLGAMLLRDKAGLVGIDMEVRWRTDRDSEHGADQVIAWTLGAGNQGIGYPGEEQQVLHWNVGQPISLMLRWAKSGTQQPVNDPLQADLRVSGLEAEWQYQGPWSLLRLMGAHVSTQRQPNMDYTDFPLSLEVPVHAPQNEENQTLMFVRLSLMSQGGKAPLSIQPLPVQAPRSPYGYAPRAIVDAGTGSNP
ncbi:type VI secretion protein IcmF/TssM N-terminal domain-containing protein [Pseudomonas sp. CCC3.2]|uniref:type VI secretion system protein n=1 Tax=unclassified Pseudomonas TaxID=196821 RepID=UPI002AB53350|nr:MULTISPECIES: type VI secretion protein IcmF/TssM N-terminal domain-containing protein [unclassified Pseudomonas]MDY7560403.1 type VI secretion protein IcmF/TssM N-terminal domain-containing protein [Pseudomonas sp. AB6]MEA9977320.1 type VI secretion protein IcmF/TssM N-terminal domain-containing protein [Pseudomonas sp. RTS4]MEB0180350.1 type VI secretion protein IcmF/TssM N-terminal domain-containing protein [Pseudomonas sp. CCC3.2]MEB0199612.1 type VI secretion protein IcmF/TssM N-termina